MTMTSNFVLVFIRSLEDKPRMRKRAAIASRTGLRQV